jgi:hypothetical protein
MVKWLKLLWTSIVDKRVKIRKILIEIAGLIITPAPFKILKWLKYIRIVFKVNFLRRTLMNENEKHGIKETSDVAEFLVGVANAVVDGFQIGDTQVLLSLPAALDGITAIPEEIADLSTEEMREVIKPIVEKLNLPDDSLELAIEYMVMAVIGFGRLLLLKKAAISE